MRLVFVSTYDDGVVIEIGRHLQSAGWSVYIWNPSLFEHSLINNQVSDGVFGIRLNVIAIDGEEKELNDLGRQDILFIRRIPKINSAHISKEHQHNHKINAKVYVNGVLRILSRTMQPVCTFDGVFNLEDKRVQLWAAQKVGLNLPRTIISNNIDSVRQCFSRDLSHNVITKPLVNLSWNSAEAGESALPVTRVDPAGIDPVSLSVYPMIFQEEVIKRSEIRLIAIGDELLALEYALKEPGPYVDSRSYTLDEYNYGVRAIDPSFKKQVLEYMELMNSRFAVFDFVIDDEGQWIFLESNAFGNYLRIEEVLDVNVSEFIASGLVKLSNEQNGMRGL